MEGDVLESETPLFKSQADALRFRTRQFALRVIRLCESLQKGLGTGVIVHQLIRSATSVGAHYREACRARSKAEFVSKVEVALQELDESVHWLELLLDLNKPWAADISGLIQEANELTAIFAASAKTVKSSLPQQSTRTS